MTPRCEPHLPPHIRGADIVARTLDAAGLTTCSRCRATTSCRCSTRCSARALRLIHVRHEAAAVHMADAWGRLTGRCGIALVSGGAGFTNAAAALSTAQAGEVAAGAAVGTCGAQGSGARRLPGAAPGRDGGAGRQGVVGGALAASAGRDLAEAVRIARVGPAGPVHLSLPSTCWRRGRGRAGALARGLGFRAGGAAAQPAPPTAMLGLRWPSAPPLVLAGPQLCHAGDLPLLGRSRPRGVPSSPMESPRGINDPRLGAFAEVSAAGRPHRAARQGARFHPALRHPPAVDAGLPVHRHRS